MADDINNKKEEFLKTRLHYFLIASAFLVTAFVTVLTAKHSSVLLMHLVAALGVSLSLLFGVMQYGMAIELDSDTKNEYEEIRHKKAQEYFFESDRKNAREVDYRKLLKQLGKDICGFLSNPVAFAGKHNTLHFWIIPFGFVVFWTIAWCIGGRELYDSRLVAGANLGGWFWWWAPAMYYLSLMLYFEYATRNGRRVIGWLGLGVVLASVLILLMPSLFTPPEVCMILILAVPPIGLLLHVVLRKKVNKKDLNVGLLTPYSPPPSQSPAH